MKNAYFTTREGRKIYFADIDRALDVLHPNVHYMSANVQLKVLGLFEAFVAGETPFVVPQTFTGCARSTLVAVA